MKHWHTAPPQRVLIAMDSFKGSLTSAEAGEAVKRGVTSRWAQAEVDVLTVSDGGEGWLDACEAAMGGERVSTVVDDPLLRPVTAHYLRCGHVAILEVAQACGLALVEPHLRDPLRATSRGVGQMVVHAIEHGATQLTIGLGGTATSDAGRGFAEAMAEAYGQRWWQSEAVAKVSFTLATDVRSPLCGTTGAARMFAPQKGASAATVELLEAEAQRFAASSATLLGHDYSASEGAGAAGGLGYVMMQYVQAQCRMGLDLLWEAYHADDSLRAASLVITGEGSADQQTLMGKLPCRVLAKASAEGVPVWLLAGKVSDAEALLKAGFSRVDCIHPQPLPLAEAMRKDVATAALTHAITA